MNAVQFVGIVNRYKKCPICGVSYKKTKMKVQLMGDVVEISCECGFLRCVDGNNKEIKR